MKQQRITRREAIARLSRLAAGVALGCAREGDYYGG